MKKRSAETDFGSARIDEGEIGEMKKVLTVAGSDSSGGAGIQADIKTMTMHKVFAMSAITAITAQNTTGVTQVEELSPELVAAQLDAVFTDIFPDAVKIGMVSNSGLIKTIADKLREHKAQKIVLDPVMVATSGARLMREDAILDLIDELIPLAEVITPNLFEAEILAERSIRSLADMRIAGEKIRAMTGVNVLIKGGHLQDKKTDILFTKDGVHSFEGKNIDNANTHGTGCTLSSAIASNLALGFSLIESVARAKRYVEEAIAAGLDLGAGRGPLDHMVRLSIDEK